MHVDPHPLSSEFPEHRARIESLRKSGDAIAAFFQEYETIDKQICRAEEDLEPMSDHDLTTLKMRRVHLKDHIRKHLEHG